MTGFGSPCGACKFLRRKCANGCVFAPYFSHEQGATHFSAIHKVFGASNVSKLLSHIPVNDRQEAAFTISYEAQARLQDPIYGCVSHIFALQQQVVNLQAQVSSLRAAQVAAQQFISTGSTSTSLSSQAEDNFYGKLQSNYNTHVQDLFHFGESRTTQQFHPIPTNNNVETMLYYSNRVMDNSNPISDYQYQNSSMRTEETVSATTSFEDSSHAIASPDHHIQSDSRKWSPSFQIIDDLQSLAFAYLQHS